MTRASVPAFNSPLPDGSFPVVSSRGFFTSAHSPQSGASLGAISDEVSMSKNFPDSRRVTRQVTDQPTCNPQAELPLMGLLRGPDEVRDDILRTFGDDEEGATRFAVRWAWDHRRAKAMTQRQAAELVGIPAPHFCNILSGKKFLPPHKLNGFQWVVGNRAVSMTQARFDVIRAHEQHRQIAEMIAANIVRAA